MLQKKYLWSTTLGDLTDQKDIEARLFICLLHCSLVRIETSMILFSILLDHIP